MQVFDLNAVPTLFSSLILYQKGRLCFVGRLFLLGTVMDFASGLIFPLLGVGMVGMKCFLGLCVSCSKVKCRDDISSGDKELRNC